MVDSVPQRYQRLIVQLLSDNAPGRRAMAAQTLAEAHFPQVLRALERARDDADPMVQRSATVSLLRLGSAPLAIELQATLHSPTTALAIAAATTLGDARCRRAVLEMLEVFSVCPRPLAIAIARALGAMGDKRAVAALCRALAKPGLGETAAEALGTIADTRSVGPLLRALSGSTSAATRAQCARSLGRIARRLRNPEFSSTIAPALEEAMLSDDRRVRMNAALSLWQLADPVHDESALRELRKLSQATQPVIISGEGSATY